MPGDASALRWAPTGRARAIESRGRARAAASVRIVRNGSRGLYWLEPLVEVVTAAGRVAYGPVTRGARCPNYSTPACSTAPRTRCASGDIAAHP